MLLDDWSQYFLILFKKKTNPKQFWKCLQDTRKTNRHLFKNKNNNLFKVEEEYADHFLILPSKKMC